MRFALDFSMLIVATLVSLVFPIVLNKYDLCKYANILKARGQKPVNTHKPTSKMCFILSLLKLIWTTVFSNEKSDHDFNIHLFQTSIFISGIKSLIIQKNRLWTNEIVMINFCWNYIIFLPENVHFLIFWGATTIIFLFNITYLFSVTGLTSISKLMLQKVLKEPIFYIRKSPSHGQGGKKEQTI